MRKQFLLVICCLCAIVMFVAVLYANTFDKDVVLCEAEYYDVERQQIYYMPAVNIEIDIKSFENHSKDNPLINDWEAALILGTSLLEMQIKCHNLSEGYRINKVYHDSARGIYFFSLVEDQLYGTPDLIMAISQYNGAVLDIMLNE